MEYNKHEQYLNAERASNRPICEMEAITEGEHVVYSLEELLTWYKRDRFEGRGKEYVDATIASHKDRLARIGRTMITRHDSRSGEAVYLFA